MRINPGHGLGSPGQFSLVLLSPVVVNAVVEEGEREELNADVEHLKLKVKVDGLKVLMAGVLVLRAETVDLLEIVIVEVTIVILVQDHGKALHNKYHQNSS